MAKLPDKLTNGPPGLVRWLNDIREFVRRGRVLSDGVLGWTDTGDGLVPPMPETALEERRSLRPRVSGDAFLFTTGLVNNETPEIGGYPLTDDPPPSIAITTSPFYAWIVIEWEPDSYSTGGTPDYVPDGGTLVTPVVIAGGSAIPADVTPTVNATTGAATLNGKHHFLIATATGTTGSYRITTERSGNRSVIICGTEDIRAAWDSP